MGAVGDACVCSRGTGEVPSERRHDELGGFWRERRGMEHGLIALVSNPSLAVLRLPCYLPLHLLTSGPVRSTRSRKSACYPPRTCALLSAL